MSESEDCPDPEVARMLEAVAEFQRDDYVMTEAEAAAFNDEATRNPPRIPPRPLPMRE
ncbi:MAG: hypothetical protein GXY58_18645 [Planctomycetaceae bacterium]|nr:hypothetical protein [Planctomycetaceae bacterium]